MYRSRSRGRPPLRSPSPSTHSYDSRTPSPNPPPPLHPPPPGPLIRHSASRHASPLPPGVLREERTIFRSSRNGPPPGTEREKELIARTASGRRRLRYRDDERERGYEFPPKSPGGRGRSPGAVLGPGGEASRGPSPGPGGGYAAVSQVAGPSPLPPGSGGAGGVPPGSRDEHQLHRGRRTSGSGREKRKITLLLCIFHSTRQHWSTQPLTFDAARVNDVELWEEIRGTFRGDLQKPWRRWFGFKRVVSVVPIAFANNGVPVKADPKDHPEAQQFLHAYHHPTHLAPSHFWIDFFTTLDASDTRPNGLQFIEGLWAEKLAIVAVLFSIAIVVVSIVWCVLGGDLQTVFTVMGFVLTFVAAEIALAALYYQVALPGA
ncbi:hypothetical protein K402DRAFT_449858 [Aulographum hederae CBS 113979]|uniref:Uncharacterized protein n=1 Tax=Aulographum hederae CBS 113979 TaxID=1176131 RepID=A0A6G1HH17_9PEZI|nr:hypothetical protein K402DRAFT_449858 [Aulographum hederae CBS 113979]